MYLCSVLLIVGTLPKIINYLHTSMNILPFSTFTEKQRDVEAPFILHHIQKMYIGSLTYLHNILYDFSSNIYVCN